MLFIGSPSNLFLRLQKKREILRNLFLRLEEFGNICGTNICDLGPKSQKFVPQKLMPQHFMPAKINALKVTFPMSLFSISIKHLYLTFAVQIIPFTFEELRTSKWLVKVRQNKSLGHLLVQTWVILTNAIHIWRKNRLLSSKRYRIPRRVQHNTFW